MHTYSYSKFLYFLLVILFIAQFLRESILSFILSLLGIWLYVYKGKGKRRKEILFPLLLVILVALGGCTLDFIATFSIYDERVFLFYLSDWQLLEAIGGRSIITWRGFLCYFVIDFIIIIMAICAIFGESSNIHRVNMYKLVYA